LPTKKNYDHENLNSNKGNTKKIIKKKDINTNNNEERNRNKLNNNAIEQSNSIKYHKIINKPKKKILYNSKNTKIIGKSKGSIKSEIDKDKIKIKEKEKDKETEETEEKEQKEEKEEKKKDIVEKGENEKNEEKKEEKDKKKEKIKSNELDKIYFDLDYDSQYKRTPPTIQPRENENSMIDLENKINSSFKNSITKKNRFINNSPNSKDIIYKKPKLFENSVKREKKSFIVNNSGKPMTTKITSKKINYIPRNITPKKGMSKITNKSEYIPTMNEKQLYSMRNKNIYKSSYASINREKAQKYQSRPIETSPAANYNTNINNSNNDIYLNILKKKNYLKKFQTQRPDSAAPLKKISKLKDECDISDKNITDFNLDNINNISNLEKKNNDVNINKEISNRENMINMLINNYNKKNINFNSYNPNMNYNDKKIGNSNYIERPMSTKNNQAKNFIKCPTLNEADFGIKNSKIIKIKHSYNKIQTKQKQNINKKRMLNKNMLERDMTEPELLKMVNPINLNDSKRENQRTLNISLTNQENNTFLHQQKPNKMIRLSTNNNPRYNQYYSNNVNQANPQIFNNYVSINNVVTPNYPVKVINVFGK
jgi:hypothetical protein